MREWVVVLRVTDDCDPIPLGLDEIRDIVLQGGVAGVEIEIIEIRMNQT